MLPFSINTHRIDKEVTYVGRMTKSKSMKVPDASWKDGISHSQLSPNRRPSSTVTGASSPSSFMARRVSESPLSIIEGKQKRPVSDGARVKRNSSNRSTASEGNRRVRKRNDSNSLSKSPSSYDDNPSLGLSFGTPISGPSPSSSSTALSVTAASLLKLVLPFSWERKHSRNSRAPLKEGSLTLSSNANKQFSDIPVPFPQRSAPPVPSSGCSLCGDHLSVSSGCSSLAGHTYEQVPFCPKSVITKDHCESHEDHYDYAIDTLDMKNIEKVSFVEYFSSEEKGKTHFDICIPGEVREVRRPSRKRKKSRNKGTYTEGHMTQTEMVDLPSCISISLPQRAAFLARNLSIIDSQHCGEQLKKLKNIASGHFRDAPAVSCNSIEKSTAHNDYNNIALCSGMKTTEVNFVNLDSLQENLTFKNIPEVSLSFKNETCIPDPVGLATLCRYRHFKYPSCKDQKFCSNKQSTQFDFVHKDDREFSDEIASRIHHHFFQNHSLISSASCYSEVPLNRHVIRESEIVVNAIESQGNIDKKSKKSIEREVSVSLMKDVSDDQGVTKSAETSLFKESIEVEGTFERETPPVPHSSPERRDHFGLFLDLPVLLLSNRENFEEVGCERYRVEGEMCQVQEALSERLGPPAVMLRRRDQRLHTINAIEKAIQKLRQDNPTTPISNGSRPRLTSCEDLQTKGYINNKDCGQISVEGDFTTFNFKDMDLANANKVGEDQDSSGTDHEHLFSELNELPGSSYDGVETDESPLGEGSKINPTIEAVLRGSWPFEKALWHSSPASVGVSYKNGTPETVPGIMSTSSVTNRRAQSQQQLLTNKVEMVYGLLSMFSSGDRDNMSRTLLAMSSSPDSCVSMRQSGCLPLLIQLLHGTDDIPPTREVRLRASQALHNIVHSHPDDKRGRREARVLRLLEQLRDYSDSLWEKLERLCAGRGPLLEDSMDRHPGPAMAALMKLSFDEEHRHAMCALGGLHAIAELIRRDHEAHGSQTADQYCTSLRRYAGMALTNLTFGDGTNKALLCSFRSFMKALVSQLHSPSEDLRQVTASVLRNLSWRADGSSKISLREVGAVVALMEAALTAKKESTLKVILSAVWNLSAHCSMNKSDICSVCGALAFICSTLTYKSHSKTLNIIENGGGILRNISSHIAVRDDLRQVLRDHNTLSVLLGQLRSPSLTIVSNACGTLWNLSARCSQDQATLWQLGAVPMLRSLINSKHKMISMGSSAALKNLLQAKPEGVAFNDGKSGIGLPTLQARRQKALEQELDPSLAETCDNIETSPRGSPTTTSGDPMFHSLGHYNNAILSDSRETILSTHSDKTHDRLQQILMNHHNGREGDLGVELPMNGISHGPNGNSHINSFNKYTNLSGNVSESSLTMNVSAKVNNLGSKYLNVRSKNDNVEEKPIPKYDNYVKESANEDSVIEKIGDDEEEQPTNFSLKYSEDKDELAVSSQDPRRRKTKVVNGEEEILSEESQFYEARSINDDSIRTFCTEGTPYNFSTSTSLSDLREIDRNGRGNEIICKEKDEEDFDMILML